MLSTQQQVSLPLLSELQAYRHSAVVRRFQKEYPSRAERAEQVFADLLLFFWASVKHSLDQRDEPAREELRFHFIMDEEMKDIDLMWHIFLLYTRDYADFCQKYFVVFLHHLPDIVPMMDQAEADGVFDWEANLEKFLSYVYDLLGEEVVRRWFPLSSA